MKICFISSCDLSVDNGGRTHTIELAKNWSTLGNEVYLFSKGLNKSECNQKFQYIKVPYIPIKGLNGISFSFFSLILLVIYNFRFKFDIIYERYMLFSLSTIAGKLLNIPIVIELNDIPYSMDINQLIRDENNSLIKIVLKLIQPLLKLDAWITSELSTKILTTTKLKIENLSKHELYSLPFGANIEIFKPLNQNECKKITNYPDNVQIICFVGTFLPWQGIEYLIKAMPLILSECPNTLLVLIGDIEPKMHASVKLKENLMNIIKISNLENNILFVGRVPYNEVPIHINSSDICVVTQTSSRSGFSPLKLFEYMACGKPIVASDIEGIREIINESGGGILAEPENPEKLTKAIIKLLKDEEVRKKMGQDGLRCIVEKYSWESVAKEGMKVCEEAINDKK